MKTLLDVFEAVEARIQSIPLACYDRDPDPTPAAHHWVMLSVDGGNLFTEAFGALQDSTLVYFRPMCVSDSQRGALDALGMLRQSLIGWDPWPDEDSSSMVFEEETTPPLLPYTGVANQFRYSITPTYKIRFDR